MKMIRLPAPVILFSLSLVFTSAALAKEKDEDESTSDEGGLAKAATFYFLISSAIEFWCQPL
jgi:hypothetical protein